MLKLLLLLRLRAVWNSMFASRRSKGVKTKRSPVTKILLGLLFVYVIAAIGFSLGMFFKMIGDAFIPNGLGWLYFAFAGMAAMLLGFIGSVFITQSELFEAKDNELLLSMPIPPVYILASRLLMLWIVDAAYSLMIFIPAGVVYCLVGTLSVAGVVGYVLGCIGISLLTMTLSCFFGWLFAMLTSKMNRKNLFTTIAMLLFFFAYFYVYSNMYNLLQTIIANGEEFAAAVRRIFPPFYFFGQASQGDLLSLLWTVLICAVPFALVIWILARSFIKLATRHAKTDGRKYKGGGIKASSAGRALVRKELGRFFSLPMYIMNCGLGAILLVVFGVMAVFRMDIITELTASFPDFVGIVPMIGIAGMCFCITMISTTSPSLSLEGSSFDLLKSLPVRARDVYNAKIICNLIIGVPSILITSTIFQFLIDMTPLMRVMLYIVPLCVQLFTAVFGMIANIWFPRFAWVNATIVIKQSASTMISILGGLAILLVPCALYVFLLNAYIAADVYCLLTALAFAAATAALYAAICTYGERKYISMG